MENIKKPLLDRKMLVIIATQFLAAGGVVGFLFFFGRGNSTTTMLSHKAQEHRQLGTQFKSVGLLIEAAAEYQHYLEGDTVLAPAERARWYFEIADLLERSGRYEEALAQLYRAKLNPSAPDLTHKIDKKTIALLERLKRFGAAKYALKQSTALNKDEKDPAMAAAAGPVVGEIDDRKIYLYQIDAAINQLPEELRGKLVSTEQKKMFLQKYLSEQVLYEKAQKLGIPERQEIREKMETVLQQLAVQKLLEEEIGSKLKQQNIDEKDLENYFIANKSSYGRPEQATVKIVKIKGKKEANTLAATASLATLKAHPEARQVTLVGGRPFEDWSHEEVDKILTTKVGSVAGPLLQQGFYHLFLVESRQQGEEAAFDQVKQKVFADYQQYKGQSLYQQLMNETVQSSRVKMYPENIK